MPPPPQPKPADPALEQRAVAALFIALLSLVGLMGLNDLSRGIYVALFAFVAGVVALWLGVTAVVRAGRVHAARPRGVAVSIVVGSIGVVTSGALLVTFGVLGRQLSNYGQCLSAANTIATQQSCYHNFQHRVLTQITVLGSGSGP